MQRPHFCSTRGQNSTFVFKQEAARAHIDTENLQAVYVVVPRFGEQEFLRSYTNVIEATLGSGPQRFRCSSQLHSFGGTLHGSSTSIVLTLCSRWALAPGLGCTEARPLLHSCRSHPVPAAG